MRISTAFSIFLLWAVFATPAGAADWQVVASAGQEKVEIDLSRIMRNGPGRSVAWTRLALGRELTDHGIRYDTVQAMNRYDCEKRTLVTLRRIYLKANIPVHDEKIASPAEIAVGKNGADGLLLNEACTPRTVSEAYATADKAGSVASAANAAATAATGGAPAPSQPGKPGVMHADVRTAGEAPSQQTITVADGDRPNSAAETKIEIRPSSERPRFIGLPKVEKPAPTEPANAQAEKGATKAAEAKPAEAGNQEQKSVKSAAKSTTTAKPATTADANTVTDATLSRHEREKQLATSGPRRYVPRPRPKAKPEPAGTEVQHDIHWSYEGAGAPEHWAKLKPEYGLCATGKRQSPIDIRDGIGVDLEPIKADYLTSYFDIVNNGHSIQVNVGEGSVITVMGRTYELVQFHFHRPAEERINGKIYPMGVHLVHRDPEGKLAVIAVLLEDGAENPLVQTLWNNLPLELNQSLTPDIAIDLLALLPADRDYYTYMGSLTTPPCTEDVLWLVFKQPLSISAEQVAIFSRLYRNNARPIQPSYSRLIKENR